MVIIIIKWRRKSGQWRTVRSPEKSDVLMTRNRDIHSAPRSGESSNHPRCAAHHRAKFSFLLYQAKLYKFMIRTVSLFPTFISRFLPKTQMPQGRFSQCVYSINNQ